MDQEVGLDQISKLTSLYYTSLISCFLSCISYFISHILYLISHISYLISHISYLLSHISYLVSHISYFISHISYLISRILFLLSCFSYISPNYHIPYLFLTSDFSPLLSCISYLAHRISSHIYQILTLTFHISCHSLFNVTSLKFRIPCPNYQVSLRESVWKFSAKAHLNGVSLISVNASRIK